MNIYHLIRIGKLLATKAALSGSSGLRVMTLLVDTGSTYTIIPAEVLESIGHSPARSKDHVRITTGSGILIVPRVKVLSFECVGKSIRNFHVVAHTLPSIGNIDGLLGMDFLYFLKGQIDLEEGTIQY